MRSLKMLAQNFTTENLNLPDVTADQGKIDTVLNILFSIIGAAAVIMIVVGGLMYTTSGGNPDKAKKAKNIILYAIIGLVVALFATAIVNFVLVRL